MISFHLTCEKQVDVCETLLKTVSYKAVVKLPEFENYKAIRLPDCQIQLFLMSSKQLSTQAEFFLQGKEKVVLKCQSVVGIHIMSFVSGK